MPDVRLAIRSRRAIVERVKGISLTLLHTLLKDVILLPELLSSLLPVHKIQICRNLLIHNNLLGDVVLLQSTTSQNKKCGVPN